MNIPLRVRGLAARSSLEKIERELRSGISDRFRGRKVRLAGWWESYRKWFKKRKHEKNDVDDLRWLAFAERGQPAAR